MIPPPPVYCTDSGIMDPEEQLKRERRREARRRKILDNASSRMERLKNMGRKFPGDGGAALPSSPASSSESAPDPPCELISQTKPTTADKQESSKPKTSIGVSFFGCVVAKTQSEGVFRVRTVSAIICGLVVALLNADSWTPISCVLSLLAVDSCVVLAVTLSLLWSRPGTPGVNPLGKLAVLQVALQFVNPAAGVMFECVCLLLCLVWMFLKDLCTMLFSTIIALAVVSLIS